MIMAIDENESQLFNDRESMAPSSNDYKICCGMPKNFILNAV